MNTIKHFIYLDNYKMNSISSQIFEGMTDYIIKSNEEKYKESNLQKGDFMSGRKMAEIIDSSKGETEKKFLYDYSYKLFEDKLISENKVLILDKNNIEYEIKKIEDFSFIKVSGRIIFNDTKHIEETMGSFNEMGGALTYITQKEEVDKIKDLEKTATHIKDRNQKSKATEILKNKNLLKEIAKEKGLYYDEESMKSLIYLLNYGYNHQLEIQMPIQTENEHFLFSSILNRDNLKEKEQSIIRKHSRISEKSFSVFGILTQIKEEKDELLVYKNGLIEKSGLKEAIMNIISQITNMEQVFVGKLPYEYIIDPIAIYQEI